MLHFYLFRDSERVRRALCNVVDPTNLNLAAAPLVTVWDHYQPGARRRQL